MGRQEAGGVDDITWTTCNMHPAIHCIERAKVTTPHGCQHPCNRTAHLATVRVVHHSSLSWQLSAASFEHPPPPPPSAAQHSPPSPFKGRLPKNTSVALRRRQARKPAARHGAARLARTAAGRCEARWGMARGWAGRGATAAGDGEGKFADIVSALSVEVHNGNCLRRTSLKGIQSRTTFHCEKKSCKSTKENFQLILR